MAVAKAHVPVSKSEANFDVVAVEDLAFALQDQGNLTEALCLFHKVLACYEKVYSPEHPQVAMALGNISTVYRQQKKLPEALNTLKKVLAIFEKVHGRNHLEVAKTKVSRFSTSLAFVPAVSQCACAGQHCECAG